MQEQVIKVLHKDMESGALAHVANVNYASPGGQELVGHIALEYAYFRTQNIAGSWSRGPELQEPGMMKIENHDYSPDTEVLVPLHEANGRVYGLRSSMVGDVFEIEGERFVVASSGFKSVQTEAA